MIYTLMTILVSTFETFHCLAYKSEFLKRYKDTLYKYEFALTKSLICELFSKALGDGYRSDAFLTLHRLGNKYMLLYYMLLKNSHMVMFCF